MKSVKQVYVLIFLASSCCGCVNLRFTSCGQTNYDLVLRSELYVDPQKLRIHCCML